MRTYPLFNIIVCATFWLSFSQTARADAQFGSPGFAPTRMDEEGRLVEDWGTVGVNLAGEGLSASPRLRVAPIQLEGIVPAARADGEQGPVTFSLTAFRAPAWPAGLDVLTVRLSEKTGNATSLQLSLSLPETVRLGHQTATIGGRTVVALPEGPTLAQAKRDWGYTDDAVSLPGWGRPVVECDPAFRNIRAGMSGVPIRYRFKVAPGLKATVVLGFCESHWDTPGQRPVLCQVEGAQPITLDPLQRWGQHKPGAVSFSAHDEDADGSLEVTVLPAPGAPDQNSILNALWIFEGPAPNIAQVIAGSFNKTALRYVDVGGPNDQSLYAGGKIEYAVNLEAGGTRELTFLLACPGASLPHPEQSAWTPERLLKAAAEVWSEWK